MTSKLRSNMLTGLVLASACYLVSASLGAALSIATDLPARFGGLFRGNDVARDFLLVGTALSPDLPLLLGQLVLTGCALRGGRTGMVGVIGLTVLGAVYVLGQVGEPIVLQAFRPATFNAAQATLVAANIIFPALMAVFGALEWRNRRRASGKPTRRER
jgi:hypothetical protein